MGEAINLVNNFKVEKVIFNCEEYNDLEKKYMYQQLINCFKKRKHFNNCCIIYIVSWIADSRLYR